MAQKHNILWYGLLLVLALSLGAVYYYFRDYLEPAAARVLDRDPGCDLRSGSCELKMPGGGIVRFEITPKSIPLLEPLTLDVAVTGVDVDSVEVDFAGVSMNMGFNRTELLAAGAGRYGGNIVLPVCVRNRMEWEARVMVETDAGIMVAPFRFETVKNR